MDIKEQIRNKYYTPTESINIVYNIFKDFFNVMFCKKNEYISIIAGFIKII